MARQKKPRKMGRPPLPPGEKKLPSVGFRPTPGLRVSLEEAARRQGRSVSKEIESRLERSVQSDEAMGGPELYALFRMLGAAANFLEAKSGKEWSEDWDTFVSVNAAWVKLIAEARPPTPKSLKDKVKALEREKPEMEPSLPPSVHTMATLPSLGLHVGEKFDVQHEKALSDFNQQMRRYRREITAYERKQQTYRRKLDDVSEHIEKLTKLGEGVAAGLLRPEGKE